MFQGTTGTPKGATLSHHNIVNNSYFIGRRLGYHEMVKLWTVKALTKQLKAYIEDFLNSDVNVFELPLHRL